MDGAWALYEAWLKIQAGHADTAAGLRILQGVAGRPPNVMSRGLDPTTTDRCGPTACRSPGLQARAMLDAGAITEREMAQIAHRNRTAAAPNPRAQVTGSASVDELLAAPMLSDPLRRHDCPPISDGGVAVVLAAGDRAREWSDRPAWIRGLDHRIDSHAFGARDLTVAPSIRLRRRRRGRRRSRRRRRGPRRSPIREDRAHRARPGRRVDVNPSGGALAANPMLAAGLIRIAEVADRISAGTADRGVAHATGGQLLQQNLDRRAEGSPDGCQPGRRDRRRPDQVRLGAWRRVAAGLLREAAYRALAGRRLTMDDIDAVVVGKAPDFFEGIMMPEPYLAEALGAVGKPCSGSTPPARSAGRPPSSPPSSRRACTNGC